MSSTKRYVNIDKKYLAEQLIRARLESGLNCSEAAARLKVSKATYSKYENRKITHPTEMFIQSVLMGYPDKDKSYFIRMLGTNSDGSVSSLPIEVERWKDTSEAEVYILGAYTEYVKDLKKNVANAATEKPVK